MLALVPHLYFDDAMIHDAWCTFFYSHAGTTTLVWLVPVTAILGSGWIVDVPVICIYHNLARTYIFELCLEAVFHSLF